MMKTVAGIESLDLPSRFSQARRRIILHAAIYGPFATSIPHRQGLTTALTSSTFEKLDIVTLAGTAPWATSFMRALRFDDSTDTHAALLLASDTFLNELQAIDPQKVAIHHQSSLPCLPVVIIDDTILFGHYAHSRTFAAEGFWSIVETNVERLFKWAENDGPPSDASAEDKAAYRIVHECHNAMTKDAS